MNETSIHIVAAHGPLLWMEGLTMHYGSIKNCSIENGEGCRVSLFVSGCRRHCKGCHNEVAWDFDYGELFTEATEDRLIEMCRPDYVDGISILGGEPLELENVVELTMFLMYFRKALPGKTVWLYTGYKYEQVKGYPIMRYVDVVVDGEYIEEQRDMMLPFRGSRNQRVVRLKGGSDA